MKRETVKRKYLQKLIQAKYSQFLDHQHYTLGKIFSLGYQDEVGCNWSLSISREKGWEAAADFIRPYIVKLRYHYALAD